jgi:valyl-tRNA synthetase
MGFNQDLPADQGGKTIMFAHWPKSLDDDFKDHYGLTPAVADFVEQKYELVRQGRNLRREANIPAGKKVNFVLKPVAIVSAHDAEVLKILLGALEFSLPPDYQPKKGTPSIRSPLGELYLPLEGLIDVEAEKARLHKELAKILLEVGKVQDKLANPNFTQKVPPAVLAEHQRRLAEWQGKQAKTEAALKALAG